MKKVQGTMHAAKLEGGDVSLTLQGASQIKARVHDMFLSRFDELDLLITLQAFGDPKTVPQLRYWKGVIRGILVEEFRKKGSHYSLDQVDDLMKVMFYHDQILIDDTVYVTPATLETATKEDVRHFIDKVIQWAWDYFGIKIMTPDEYLESLLTLKDKKTKR